MMPPEEGRKDAAPDAALGFHVLLNAALMQESFSFAGGKRLRREEDGSSHEGRATNTWSPPLSSLLILAKKSHIQDDLTAICYARSQLALLACFCFCFWYGWVVGWVGWCGAVLHSTGTAAPFAAPHANNLSLAADPGGTKACSRSFSWFCLAFTLV